MKDNATSKTRKELISDKEIIFAKKLSTLIIQSVVSDRAVCKLYEKG